MRHPFFGVLLVAFTAACSNTRVPPQSATIPQAQSAANQQPQSATIPQPSGSLIQTSTSSRANPIPNRLAPVRGAELFTDCGGSGTANDMLLCLERCPEFIDFQTAWPDVPNGSPSGSIHAVWLMRVIDAAVKGRAELHDELGRCMATMANGLSASDLTKLRALLAAVDRAQLLDEDVAFACQVAELEPHRASVTQQLIAVGIIVFHMHAVTARNRLD